MRFLVGNNNMENLMNGGAYWAPCPTEVLYMHGLSDVAFRVYTALAAHFNHDKRRAWPSQQRLAGMLGKSERTIRRALQELVDHNLIMPKGKSVFQTVLWALPGVSGVIERWGSKKTRAKQQELLAPAEAAQEAFPFEGKGGDLGPRSDLTGGSVKTVRLDRSNLADKQTIHQNKEHPPLPPSQDEALLPVQTDGGGNFASLWNEFSKTLGKPNAEPPKHWVLHVRRCAEIHGWETARKALLGAANDSWWRGEDPPEKYSKGPPSVASIVKNALGDRNRDSLVFRFGQISQKRAEQQTMIARRRAKSAQQRALRKRPTEEIDFKQLWSTSWSPALRDKPGSEGE